MFYTANQVIASADVITKHARDRLTRDEIALHDMGYHKYSTAICNLRCAIERAMSDLADDLMED